MSMTRTYTKTKTFTAEERAILSFMKKGRFSRGELEAGIEVTLKEEKSELSIDDELLLTILGQLIERGWVERIEFNERGYPRFKYQRS